MKNDDTFSLEEVTNALIADDTPFLMSAVESGLQLRIGNEALFHRALWAATVLTPCMETCVIVEALFTLAKKENYKLEVHNAINLMSHFPDKEAIFDIADWSEPPAAAPLRDLNVLSFLIRKGVFADWTHNGARIKIQAGADVECLRLLGYHKIPFNL